MEGFTFRRLGTIVPGWCDFGIYDPGVGPYRPWGALDLFSSPSQSAINKWGCGFHTVRGGIDPGELCFRPQAVGIVDLWIDFRSGVGVLSSPGDAGKIFESQPISDRPLGLGFLCRAGWYRPGESFVSTPGCLSCRDTEGFPNRGWGPPSPGAVGLGGSLKGRLFARPPRTEPQGIRDITRSPVRFGFSHSAGRYRPGGTRFRPRVVGSVDE